MLWRALPLFLAACLLAQEQPAPPQIDPRALPPSVRLGLRVQQVRLRIGVIPVAVIVPDAASYVAAVSGWTTAARYPVLIDDGSQPASEDIGRFVRAFAPERIVRFKVADAWPGDGPDRRQKIEDTVAAAWGALGVKNLGPKWSELKYTPPGIVIASEADPAWTAALALAAGRGQPLAWINSVGAPAGVGQDMTMDSANSLAAAVESACQATGLPWKDLGDALDSVTICLDVPGRVLSGGDDRVALTDFVGRRDDGAGRVQGGRWAWCGQVFGPEPRCAYAAMCALFLQPKAAWLFDGYQDTPPYSMWDATKAADPLNRVGIVATVSDTPHQGAAEWELRSSIPLQAGLVMVNTQGGADYFDLAPGRERSGDVPVLGVPAMVYFVHSWSAANPGDRATIAGRWLERGVYAFAGSIQEPYLQAFPPTPTVAARLLALPWGAAVRLDDGPAWRITVIGDPLMTLGPPAPKAAVDLPLVGVTDAADGLALLLQAKEYARALRLLVLLGRDGDAARLARGLLDSDAKAVTSEIAAESVLPVFRAAAVNRGATIAVLFGRMNPIDAARPGLRDALWLACLPGLGATRDEAVLNALSDNLRPDQPGRDAAALAVALGAVHGRPAAEALLARARALRDYYPDHVAVDDAVRRLGN
ncbi:MAG: hypothetical protein IT437_07675 [Phycisphaerales bacterium]|nr:hypothetical protein [Phycisphaerales bacterium]